MKKINAKRRRSKKQIEKDKQEAAIKEAEVANSVAKFKEYEDKLAKM